MEGKVPSVTEKTEDVSNMMMSATGPDNCSCLIVISLRMHLSLTLSGSSISGVLRALEFRGAPPTHPHAVCP